jgi:hypothetical protein
VRQLRATLESAKASVLAGSEDSLDRALVANLVVRYVSARHDKRVLELMARILVSIVSAATSLMIQQFLLHRDRLLALLVSLV